MKLTPTALGFPGLHPEVEWPEIALRFVLCQEGVHTAVAGTTSSVNARANVAAMKHGPLPEDVVRRIRDAFRDAEKAAGTTWPGQV